MSTPMFDVDDFPTENDRVEPPGMRLREADMLQMLRRRYSRIVSRADWLTELKHPEKAGEFIPYMDYWWLVVSDQRISAHPDGGDT